MDQDFRVFVFSSVADPFNVETDPDQDPALDPMQNREKSNFSSFFPVNVP